MRKYRSYIAVLTFVLLLVGMQDIAHAAMTSVYSNDFEVNSEGTEFSDKFHRNVLYKSESVLDLRTLIYDKVTITMWLKPMKNTREIDYIVALDDKPEVTTEGTKDEVQAELSGLIPFKNPGNTGDEPLGVYIATDYTKDPRWLIGTGKKTINTDTLVILDEWIFVAITLDAENEQLRTVINDKVYARKWKEELLLSRLYANSSSCMVDEVRVYPEILSLEELEKIKGASIQKDAWKYEIIDKTKYINDIQLKSQSLKEELDRTPGQLMYKVTSSLIVEKRIDSEKEYAAQLHRGDIITIKGVVVSEHKVFIETPDGKTGYIGTKDFATSLLRLDAGWFDQLLFTYNNIGDTSNSQQLILVFLVSTIILLVFLGFTINKITAFDGMEIRGIFAPAIFIYLVLLLVNFMGDTYEKEWFLQEGWRHFPYGYTDTIHWFLFSMTVIFILYHLVKLVLLLRHCGLLRGVVIAIAVMLSNIFFFHIIPMILALGRKQFGTVGVVGASVLLLVWWILYCRKNGLFLSPEKMGEDKIPYLFDQNVENGAWYEASNDATYVKKTRWSRKAENNQEPRYDQKTESHKKTWSNSEDDRSSMDGKNTRSDDNDYSNKKKEQYYRREEQDQTYGSQNNGNQSNDKAYDKQTRDDRTKDNRTYDNKTNQNTIDIQFFIGVSNQEDLKERYRGLMKLYHPDNHCGDTGMSKQIASEYEYLKKILPQQGV